MEFNNEQKQSLHAHAYAYGKCPKRKKDTKITDEPAGTDMGEGGDTRKKLWRQK
jgi:hypothetical protein